MKIIKKDVLLDYIELRKQAITTEIESVKLTHAIFNRDAKYRIATGEHLLLMLLDLEYMIDKMEIDTDWSNIDEL